MTLNGYRWFYDIPCLIQRWCINYQVAEYMFNPEENCNFNSEQLVDSYHWKRSFYALPGMKLITGSMMPWWVLKQSFSFCSVYSGYCVLSRQRLLRALSLTSTSMFHVHCCFCVSCMSLNTHKKNRLESSLLYELKEHICVFNYPYFICSAEAIKIILWHDVESRTRSSI